MVRQFKMIKMNYLIFALIALFFFIAPYNFAQSLSKEEVITLNNKLDGLSSLGEFRCGRALAVKKDKYGFIDKKGKFIIPCNFPLTAQIAYPFPVFQDGIFIGEDFVINDKGRVLEKLTDFSSFVNDNQWNSPLYITHNGKFDIYKGGKKTGSYNNLHLLYGSILVSVVPTNDVNYFGNNNKFYLTNVASKNNVEYESQFVSPILQKDGSYLLCIGKNNKVGIIDENFNEVVPFIFDTRYQDDAFVYHNMIYYSNGFVLEQLNCEQIYKLKDLSGNEILPFFYESVNIGSKYIYAQKKRKKLF